MLKISIEQISGHGSGRTYSIPRGTTKIGRTNTDIEINNERISAVHAELHYSGTRIFVIDRNSTNGTYVNGRRTRRTPLKDGDIISFGGNAEKAVAVFKVNISGEIAKVVYIFNRSMESNIKYIYILLGIFIIMFFIWISIPEKTDLQLKDGSRPWEEAQEIVPAYGGTTVMIAMNDTVMLPPQGNWKSSVKYELTGETGSYEPRIYIVDLWSEADSYPQSLEKMVIATISIQRFRPDFVGSVEQEITNNFVWHEKVFLKDNKIDAKFSYSNGSLGVWQWLIWEDDEKQNLYATCVTKRGRIMLQASSFDIYSLKRFFQYVANSYKEGSIDTEPLDTLGSK
jgi:hypothetical protein